MPSGCLGKALGIHSQTAQVVALLLARLSIQLALGFTHAEARQPRPRRLLFDIIRRVDVPVPPRFKAPVLAVYGFVSADLIAKRSLIDNGIKEALDFVVEAALIAFQGQHVIGLLLENLGGGIFLAMQRIQRDDTAFQFQQAQQLRHRGDLIGIRRGLDLPQHQAIGARPGRDQFDGPLTLAFVVRAAQCLAVKGDDLLVSDLRHGTHPIEKALLKGFGVESRQDSAEGVMRGDAVGEFEELAQPSFFGEAELFHIGEAISAADDGTGGNEEDVNEFVVATIFLARVSKIGKVVDKVGSGLIRLQSVEVLSESENLLDYPRFNQSVESTPVFIYDAIALAQPRAI